MPRCGDIGITDPELLRLRKLRDVRHVKDRIPHLLGHLSWSVTWNVLDQAVCEDSRSHSETNRSAERTDEISGAYHYSSVFFLAVSLSCYQC